MSTRIMMYDGGTSHAKQWDLGTGMDQIRWTSGPWWDRAGAVVVNQDETNAEMRDLSTVECRPWPLRFSNHMPFDNTTRHIPMKFRLDTYDQVFDECCPSPGGSYQFKETDDDPLARSHMVKSAAFDQEEIRARAVSPGDWLMIEPKNKEQGCALGDQCWMEFQGLDEGAAYRFALEDNDYFVPFDLGKPERYKLFRNGQDYSTTAGHGLGQHDLNLHSDGSYRLHLRPRLWLVQAWCKARFYWGDMFTGGYDDVVFIVQSHMRPPIYPYRQNVYVSKQTQPIYDWWGVPVSDDHAIDYAFYMSEAAANLSRQIWLMEWKGWSSAYLLVSVTPATLYVFNESPVIGDVTCIIQPLDEGEPTTGIEVVQHANLDAIYPRYEVGVFYSDFFRWDLRP